MIEKKKPSIALSPLAVIGGLCAGGLLVASNNVFVGAFVACFVTIMLHVILTLTAPPSTLTEKAICANLAREHFRAEYPDERIQGVELRHTSQEQFIFSVYYEGMGRPSPRMYFAVSRSDHSVNVEDLRTWWPRALK
jgi:hypothetical protein